MSAGRRTTRSSTSGSGAGFPRRTSDPRSLAPRGPPSGLPPRGPSTSAKTAAVRIDGRHNEMRFLGYRAIHCREPEREPESLDCTERANGDSGGG